MKRLRWRGLVIALAAVVVAGCSDSGPTTPQGQDLIYEGILATGGRDIRPLLLVDEGSIRITLTEAVPLIFQLPPDLDEPVFSVGVGVGSSELSDDGTCQITFGTSLTEDAFLTVFLEDEGHCLVVFDDGSLPPEAQVEWEITVSDVIN